MPKIKPIRDIKNKQDLLKAIEWGQEIQRRHWVEKGYCADLHGHCDEDYCDCHHSLKEARKCKLQAEREEGEL